MLSDEAAKVSGDRDQELWPHSRHRHGRDAHIVLSYCYTTLLSYYHAVILSFCPSVLLSFFHSVILSCCHIIIRSDDGCGRCGDSYNQAAISITIECSQLHVIPDHKT